MKNCVLECPFKKQNVLQKVLMTLYASEGDSLCYFFNFICISLFVNKLEYHTDSMR